MTKDRTLCVIEGITHVRCGGGNDTGEGWREVGSFTLEQSRSRFQWLIKEGAIEGFNKREEGVRVIVEGWRQMIGKMVDECGWFL